MALHRLSEADIAVTPLHKLGSLDETRGPPQAFGPNEPADLQASTSQEFQYAPSVASTRTRFGLGRCSAASVTETGFDDDEWDGEAEVVRLYGKDWKERHGVMESSAEFCPGLEAGRMICTMCHAQLTSYSTVLSHFESKRHRRWLAWHNAELQAHYAQWLHQNGESDGFDMGLDGENMWNEESMRFAPPPPPVPRVFQTIPENERAALFGGDWSTDGEIPLPPQPETATTYQTPSQPPQIVSESEWCVPPPPPPRTSSRKLFLGQPQPEEEPAPPSSSSSADPLPPRQMPPSFSNAEPSHGAQSPLPTRSASAEDSSPSSPPRLPCETLLGQEVQVLDSYNGHEVLENGDVEEGYLPVTQGEMLRVLAGPEMG
eukprot:CAMPEP_0178372052 /NCGR_PEP_ID=MMETSP0689_2-20121128/1149_1 /TAXON_ID=160604 /ORGANISM="Amphidinium massartii, Strain CS-259" /LENGTH=373 /DNA_ID=CAMNT_0019991953 /DNA_START=14 /DNA_END=1132 /DNA_ORIENTATION=-